ncbi:hypothetical protein JCM19235_6324 [Vibrio maritimus]|uniref:Uncharacterized protein n=1 Tax=Vibrio maritimus TaxID=990268 RepID=A0A090RR57_9VIBR|nr:hypothetical protein JCM19235_6324 [Vibrio maritimus]
MLDYNVRCQLVDMFIDDLEQSNVERSDIEEALYQPTLQSRHLLF